MLHTPRNPKIAKIVQQGLDQTSGEVTLHEYIAHGKRGIAFSGAFRDREVCAKVYYSRLPLCFSDPAEMEFRCATRANLELDGIQANLQTPIAVAPSQNLGKLFVSERITNFDGSIAKPCSLNKDKLPPSFASNLRRAVEYMWDKGVIYRFTNPNTLIRWIDKATAIPVFIDFQSYQNYWHQPLTLVRQLLWSSKRKDMRKWGSRLLKDNSK